MPEAQPTERPGSPYVATQRGDTRAEERLPLSVAEGRAFGVERRSLDSRPRGSRPGTGVEALEGASLLPTPPAAEELDPTTPSEDSPEAVRVNQTLSAFTPRTPEGHASISTEGHTAAKSAFLRAKKKLASKYPLRGIICHPFPPSCPCFGLFMTAHSPELGTTRGSRTPA